MATVPLHAFTLACVRPVLMLLLHRLSMQLAVLDSWPVHANICAGC